MSDAPDREVGREDERMAEWVADAYRRTPEPDPSARARLDRLLELRPSPRRRGRALAWLLEPRTFQVSPVGALAAAIATLVLGVAIGRILVIRSEPGGRREARSAATSVPAPGAQVVQFVLVAPRASQVFLVGDFNGWDPTATPMERHGEGDTWTVHMAVPTGRHVYAFVMNGDRWINDPLAPLAPANEFGFRNSVIVVGEPAAS